LHDAHEHSSATPQSHAKRAVKLVKKNFAQKARNDTSGSRIRCESSESAKSDSLARALTFPNFLSLSAARGIFRRAQRVASHPQWGARRSITGGLRTRRGQKR
jgi:hypothetical protein